MKARLPQGMGKGPSGNMNQMLKQAQKMQDDITALQAELEEREFSASVGGGAVEITINGKRNVLDLKIKPEVVDPDDVEMLQDLIMSAFNEAVHNLDETSDAEMQKLTGGVSIPGLF
ncbi:MAG: YbaB/EbfC family nucleoid-associated protein [Ruminococcus sp.]|nr:YbaB/EbfC family nucleoid-associated protein [Ruminococcus sp.]